MHKPSEIRLCPNPPQLDQTDFELSQIKTRKDYQRQLEHWQIELLKVQHAYFHQNRPAVIVFEGWDASGKGGAIRRITEKLDPRGYRVYPISAPTPREQQRHYLYRFQKHLPPNGRFAIFDRSYYGRVLVERIEGFASKRQWQRAYQEINEFERMLLDDGVRIIKLFLHITPQEQLIRFEKRLGNPYKRWKLTLEDIRNRDRWSDYETAIDEMFQHTSTEKSPWHLIAANHKWFARIEVLKILVNALTKGVDVTPPPIDKTLVKAAKDKLGIGHDLHH